MKVLIAGGTGLIGSALADSLQDDGHQVAILTRNPAKVSPGFRVVSWEENDLVGAVSQMDAIVNLAGESLAGGNPLLMRWTKKRKARILTSRMEVGANLLDAIQKAEPRPTTLVQASAIGYYGNQGEEAADEGTPMGSDFLAQVCLDWEGSTREVEQLGIRRVVIRIGLVLSQKGGLLPLLSLPFRLFVGGRLGSGRQTMSWIHIDDIIGAVKYLLLHPETQGVYNLTAPEPVTNSIFAQTLGKTLQRTAWFPVPAFALKLLLGDASTLALDGRQVLPGRLQRTTFQFHYPELAPALNNLLA
ncbi:MAG: TIGR01777 family oxidoreductase [Anaerolineales bacterium]